MPCGLLILPKVALLDVFEVLVVAIDDCQAEERVLPGDPLKVLGVLLGKRERAIFDASGVTLFLGTVQVSESHALVTSCEPHEEPGPAHVA